MFIFANPEDQEHIAYFDAAGNKYIARGGTLAWRINNPGLVQSHSHVAKKNGSIGACTGYAIFPNPEQGMRALASWLRLKKYFNSTLKTLGKHYQPNDPEGFVLKLQSLSNFPNNQKIKTFSKQEFDLLMRAIEKFCNFVAIGNEELSLLPKIDGRIEHGEETEDSYLIGGDIILSKTETIAWIESFRLDASIVHESNGSVYLRSRPHHSLWHIKVSPLTGNPLPEDAPIATLARTVGQRKAGQCIWGFVNGMFNKKETALRYSEIISSATGGEAVISLPNDTQSLIDICTVAAQKIAIDTPTIFLAIRFFRYLLALSQEESPNRPVIIFVHSQGAIICERALRHLAVSERNNLRIFSIGGGSFIAPGQSHPDSHNYSSATDPICRLGSPHLQLLALEKYTAQKNDISTEELIQHLAMRDALLQIDSLNPVVIQAYAKERCHFYEQEFEKISNITILDADPDCSNQHAFESKLYQAVIQEVITRYKTVR